VQPSRAEPCARFQATKPKPETREQGLAEAGSSAAFQGASWGWVESLRAESLRLPGWAVKAVSFPNYTPTGMRGGMPLESSHAISSAESKTTQRFPSFRGCTNVPFLIHRYRVDCETSRYWDWIWRRRRNLGCIGLTSQRLALLIGLQGWNRRQKKTTSLRRNQGGHSVDSQRLPRGHPPVMQMANASIITPAGDDSRLFCSLKFTRIRPVTPTRQSDSQFAFPRPTPNLRAVAARKPGPRSAPPSSPCAQRSISSDIGIGAPPGPDPSHLSVKSFR
jgi:hypothetical protein